VADHRDRQLAVFRKMLRFTAFLSFPLMLGLAFVSKEFIVIALGEKWMPSVSILQLLCIWGAFAPIATLYTNLLLSKGKSDVYMWSTMSQCLLQLGAMLVCYPHGIHVMVVASVSISVGWLAVWHYFVHRETGLTLWHALKDVVPFLVITAISLAAGLVVTQGLTNLYVLLAVKILTVAAVYLLLMWLSNATIFRESIAYLRHVHKPS
jgi:O-antigen/teichoic acid export membrane protein